MISVQHHGGSYPISVRPVLEAIREFKRDGDAIVTDRNLARLYPEVLSTFKANVVVEPGEKSKSMATYSRVQSDLILTGVNRQSRIWAFGGGVVGDLAGFVAATFLRGVPLIQVPTSLLAMVDSSVGGKVGIDLPEGKNLVGSFWAPTQVILDINLLRTLPPREMINGMAEVWKYGYICDKELLNQLRSHRPLPEFDDLSEIVLRCIRLKAGIVEADEFETTGQRAILNFGHTVGHAIEKALDYETLLHGEAISIGMVMESILGEKLGISPAGTSDQIRQDLSDHGLPVTLPPHLQPSNLIPLMRTDKKSTSHSLGFSFLEAMGKCKLYQEVSEQEALAAWSQR